MEVGVGWRRVDIDRLRDFSAAEWKVLHAVSPLAGPDNRVTVLGVVGFEEKLEISSSEAGRSGLALSIAALFRFCDKQLVSIADAIKLLVGTDK